MSLTPMEKALPLSAFCPQAWRLGVQNEVQIAQKQDRTNRTQEAKHFVLQLKFKYLLKIYLSKFLHREPRFLMQKKTYLHKRISLL